MNTTCQECGAPLRAGKSCGEHFHALLLLEQEVFSNPRASSDGRGEIAHFHAVSAYLLQHPDGMNVTSEALEGIRRGLSDHLAGKISLSEHRRRVRAATDGPTRVTRREGDEIVRWPVDAWPMTIVDVLSRGPDGYGDRVTKWAESVLRALDDADA